MKKRLVINSTITMLYQVIAVIIGLILPRLILEQFGSDVNGVATSVTQLLSVISLLDLGVGAVVQSTLYKPLADKDNKRVSIVYSRARAYFANIAKALLVYVILLCLYYGLFKSDSYSWIYTSSLIFAIAINFFGQYYFGVVNTLLLNADQRIYVVTLVNLLGLILNAIATILMLRIGASIQMVKLVSSVVFLIRPLALNIYVKRNYSIRIVHNPPKDAIPNQWSGLAQHITVAVTNSIDNVMLTVFGTFIMISIYNIYVLPLNSIRNLVEITSNSYKSFFGNIIAREDRKKLLQEFDRYESLMHFLITVIMSTAMVTLIPFVLIYTNEVKDANYNAPLFCIMISLAYFMFILRIVYTNLIFAGGKFKETQNYCVIECLLNAGLSLLLVEPLGLSGVAIGTLISSGYRMFASVHYLKRDILYRPLTPFVMHLVVDCLCLGIVFGFGTFYKCMAGNFVGWMCYAMAIFLFSTCSSAMIHFCFYRNQMIDLIKGGLRRLKL